VRCGGRRSPQLKIGVKYCGGCRAQYNRVKAVERIKRCLGDLIAVVTPDEEDIDLVLVVVGCETACVDMSSFHGRHIRLIASAADADAFIEEIRQKMEE